MKLKNKELQYLLDIADLWEQKISSCRFAGEIALPEKDFLEIVRVFSRYRAHLKAYYIREYKIILVILAVNCAYFYYDDNGFWVHFCKLLESDNNYYVTEEIGQAIEKALLEKGLLKSRREGPFRYVGAILEQCGVPRKYMDSFARLVNNLKSTAGCRIPYEEYTGVVKNYVSGKYLKNFLLDREGWRLTQQVCRLLVLFKSGSIIQDDLKELRGFHPEFWDELISVLKDNPFVYTISTYLDTFDLPKLKYDIYSGKVGIYFPTTEMARGFEFNGTETRSVMFYGREHLKSSYSGFIKKNGSKIRWGIEGWDPDKASYVLFDMNRGYVAPGKSISPGRYILLAPGDLMDFYNLVESELGPASIPGKKYNAYVIRVVPGDDLSFCNIGVRIDNFNLKWDENTGKRLAYCTDFYNVFCEKLPEISIQFDLLNEKEHGLFYDIGHGPVRIKDYKHLNTIKKHIENKLPVKGKFWIEFLGRDRNESEESIRSCLDFCLMPRCQIEFSNNRMFGATEEPELKIDCSEQVESKVFGVEKHTSVVNKWKVPQYVESVSGNIICKDIKVKFTVPVPRVKMVLEGREKETFIEHSLFEKEQSIIIYGPRNQRPEIALCLEGNCNYHLIQECFNNYGKVKIKIGELKNLIAGMHAGEFYIWFDNFWLSTGMKYLNLQAIEVIIGDGQKLGMVKTIDTNLYQCLNLCQQIYNNVQEEKIYLEKEPNFGQEVNEWLYEIFASTQVMDSTEFLLKSTELFDWKEKLQYKKDILKTFALYEDAVTVTENKVKAGKNKINHLIKESNKLAWFPRVPRLYYKLYDIIDLLQESNIHLQILKKWRDEVNRKVYTGNKSDIAKLEGGRDLTRAWCSYIEGNMMETLNRIKQIPSETSEIITDLKNILHVILMVRNLRLTSALQIIEKYYCQSDLLLPVWQGTTALANLATGQSVESDLQQNGNKEYIKSLPFPEDDLILIELSLGNIFPGEVVKDIGAYGDWLMCWLIINMDNEKISTNVKSKVAQKLLEEKHKIPESPEKQSVIQKISQYF